MKKILLILLLSVMSMPAHAVIVTEKPIPGIPARANTPGIGYSPPPSVQDRPINPTTITQQPPVPGYIENGRPVFPGQDNNGNSKTCRDKTGMIIKCDTVSAKPNLPASVTPPVKPVTTKPQIDQYGRPIPPAQNVNNAKICRDNVGNVTNCTNTPPNTGTNIVPGQKQR